MNICYYIAMSLDGFIARSDGDISWLSVVEREGEDYGYSAFYKSVDVVLMGRLTYELSLSFPDWPYPGKPAWVWSRRRNLPRGPQVTITDGSPAAVVDNLKKAGVRKAWLVGGGELARDFRQAGLINEYVVSIIPVLLGSGAPMIATDEGLDELSMTSVNTFPSGLVQIRYRVETQGVST